MSAPRAIVVADDLTGAADAGAPFAAAGFSTAVPLRAVPDGADVIAISNDTRDASGDRIEALFSASLELLPPTGPETLWYAKVDSAFRGYPGPEIAFLLRRTGRRAAIVAPALPDQGRMTVDGCVYVRDVLLTESTLGAGRRSSDVVGLLGLPGDLGRTIGLETVRQGPDALQAEIAQTIQPIVVVDAESNGDLAIIAEASVGSATHLLAGSAGFSKQIAQVLGDRNDSPAGAVRFEPVRSVLTVAGSRHDSSARQVRALEDSGVETVQLDFGGGHLDPATTERTVERLDAAFDEGRSITLTTCGTPNSLLPGAEIAHALSAIADDPRVRDRFDALILTGGDVAAAVCDRLEADAIWLGGEVVPSIPWGVLSGGQRPGLPIVTKAGSFGNTNALIAAVGFLRSADRATTS